MSSKSDSCSAAVIAVLYVISWYIGPRYNGARLYYNRSVFCNNDLPDLILLSQGTPAGSSTNFPISSFTNCLIDLMPCQNARSFLADGHISHIRNKFPKLSTTCMGYRGTGRLRSRWLFTCACVGAQLASGSVLISIHLS